MASDENRWPILLAVIVPTFTVTLAVCIALIFTHRHYKRALTAADYIIIFAMFADAISFALITAGVGRGFGKHTSAIPNGTADLSTISNLLLGALLAGAISSGLARISIASRLLRLESICWKRLILWTIIVLQILSTIAYEIMQPFQCKDRITSQSRVSERCLDRQQVLTSSYISIGICSLGDSICAIISICLIYPLSLPRREKVLVIILMMLCLLATVCGIPKIYYVRTYNQNTSDPTWELIPETVFYEVEQGLIIIAACAPSLKRPVEKALKWLGLPMVGMSSRGRDTLSSALEGIQADGDDASKTGDRPSMESLEVAAARLGVKWPPRVHVRGASKGHWDGKEDGYGPYYGSLDTG